MNRLLDPPNGAYEIRVGPGGVWAVAREERALEGARRWVERLLGPEFPWHTSRHAGGLEARLRFGS